MANLIMTNWYIKDKTPYIVIGTAGENNATSISIQCDEIIENAEYFLDIGDTKNDIFNTQELTVKQQITPTGETTNILYLQPMRSFLGKEGVKLLQVRCEYINNDEKVTKESNVFHAVVNKNTGFSYKFDIAIFQQYLNKIKELAAKVAEAISNITLEELKDTNIVNPTNGQVIKYDAQTQKWVNSEGGGSGSGDMLASTYDPNGTVANAGGIEEYVEDEVSSKMDATNPTGTGALSLNRKANTTIGTNSVAEGNNCTASGNNSHAEGDNSTSSGFASHAEGNYSVAAGSFSHAEGISVANGNYSHAQNMNTVAGGVAQTAMGTFNSNKQNTLLEVGNGADANNRSNAFEVYSDGSLSTDNGVTKVKLEDLAIIDISDSFYSELTEGITIADATIYKQGKHIFGTINMSGITPDIQQTPIILTYPSKKSHRFFYYISSNGQSRSGVLETNGNLTLYHNNSGTDVVITLDYVCS